MSPDRLVIPHSLRFCADVTSTEHLVFTVAYLLLHSPSGHVSSQDGPHGVLILLSEECSTQLMCVPVLVDAQYLWLYVLRLVA